MFHQLTKYQSHFVTLIASDPYTSDNFVSIDKSGPQILLTK